MEYLILLAIILAGAYIYISSKKKNDSQKLLSEPSRFGLLNDNGDPLQNTDQDSVVVDLQYFCMKSHGLNISVWPKNQKFPDYIEFTLAGMTYRKNIENYIGEFKGTLVAEPTNPFDVNAIKVLAQDGHHVGYVPKDMTDEIRRNVQLPFPCFCFIGINNGTYFSDCYITIPDVSPNP